MGRHSNLVGKTPATTIRADGAPKQPGPMGWLTQPPRTIPSLKD